MSELQLRAILAAIILAGSDPGEATPGYTPEQAAELADQVLLESVKKMVSIHAERRKRQEADARQATGARP